MPCRAVVIAENIGVFEEFVAPQHVFESLARNKVVFASVLLAASRRARCVGNGELQVRDEFTDLVNERSFAGAGRCRDHVDDAAHSRFCTCSRDFSIADFIRNPSSVMRMASPAIPVVFESIVLASRFISCSRKSSRLPTSPPPFSTPR